LLLEVVLPREMALDFVGQVDMRVVGRLLWVGRRHCCVREIDRIMLATGGVAILDVQRLILLDV
jgi:hypothetical protein